MSDLRKALHRQVALSHPVNAADIARVNTVSRHETMKDEMRRIVSALSEPSSEAEKELMVLEHLAIDWVYSQVLDWDDSAAAKLGQRIVETYGHP